MKEQNLPGFSAEASLYKTADLYGTAVTSDRAFTRIWSQVRPALQIGGFSEADGHQCYLDCIDAGHAKMLCFDRCYPGRERLVTQGASSGGGLFVR